jgi:hypothetical protein
VVRAAVANNGEDERSRMAVAQLVVERAVQARRRLQRLQLWSSTAPALIVAVLAGGENWRFALLGSRLRWFALK